MGMRRSTLVGVATVVGLVVAMASGCGSEQGTTGDGSGDGGGSPGGIAGEYVVDADGGWDPVDGVDARITFEDGSIEFYGDCNRLTGEMSWDGNTLVTEGLGGTEIGCRKELHRQDEWFADFLAGRPRATVHGDDVELTSGSTTVYLVPFVVTPDAELVGTTWLLTGIAEESGDVGSVSTIPDEARTTIRFRDDGRAVLDVPCNAATAPRYVVEGDLVRHRGFGRTAIGCPGTEREVENAVMEILNTHELEWSIQEDGLSLRPTGQPDDAYRELRFVVAPS